jgi:hypothetical protein
MAAKKTGKKTFKLAKGGIRVIDGDEPVTTAKAKKAPAPVKPSSEVVRPDGIEWGVRMKGEERVASEGRGDRVAQELAKCTDVGSLVAFANEFLDADKVQSYLEKAPNFGQFRMVVGNCIRGAISRADRENKKTAKVAK